MTCGQPPSLSNMAELHSEARQQQHQGISSPPTRNDEKSTRLFLRNERTVNEDSGLKFDQLGVPGVAPALRTDHGCLPRMARNAERLASRETRDEAGHNWQETIMTGLLAKLLRRIVSSCHRNGTMTNRRTVIIDDVTADSKLLHGDFAVPREEQDIPIVVSHGRAGRRGRITEN